MTALAAMLGVLLAVTAPGGAPRPAEAQADERSAIVFSENDLLPVESLSSCVAAAPTYHRAKSPPRSK